MVSGSEIALFIEDAVIGEEHLVIDTLDFSASDHRRGVVNRSGPVHETHHGADVANSRGKLFQRPHSAA